MRNAIRKLPWKPLCWLTVFCLLLLQGVCLADPELPATLYHNPDGGSYYHTDANCPSVKADYLPLSPFDSALLADAPYSGLRPCPLCVPGVNAAMPACPPAATDGPAPAASMGGTTPIETSMEAAAFANAFFMSPYVGEATAPYGLPVKISQTQDGWRAETTGAAAARLTLLFDSNGHVALYQNADYPLPLLENGIIPINGADDLAYTWDVLNAVDQITRTFLHRSYDAIACYGADNDSYAYHLDGFDCFVQFRSQPTLHLVGLGDLSQNACYYDGYLSRGEAVALARNALNAACGLTREQADALLVSHTSFNPNAYQPLPDDTPLTYWYVGFAITPDGKNGAYQVELDAKTGEVLITRAPDDAGQS